MLATTNDTSWMAPIGTPRCDEKLTVLVSRLCKMLRTGVVISEMETVAPADTSAPTATAAGEMMGAAETKAAKERKRAEVNFILMERKVKVIGF